MSSRNILGLTAVRNLIALDPENHDQGYYSQVPGDLVDFGDGDVAKVSCGTSGCVAGWATHLAGDKYVIYSGDKDYESDVYYPSYVVTRGGKVKEIEDRAQKLLGLTGNEADVLFDACPSTSETLDTLDRLIAGDKIVNKDGEFIERTLVNA